MRLLLAGTSGFAVASLIALAEAGHDLAAVVTPPNRPAGRGRRAAASPVRIAAERLGLVVRTPENVNDEAEVAALAALAPDVLVVAAYGRILRPVVLDLPRHGCVNVHGSLLPAWRGASPVAHALLAGDDTTGVTIMQMDEGLDTGPILSAEATPIRSGENRGDLMARLGVLGARLLVRTLDDLAAGRLTPAPQDDRCATYAPPLDKLDGALDWRRPAPEVERRVRAFTPQPGAFTRLAGTRWLVRRARVMAPQEWPVPPGTCPGTLAAPLKGRGVPVCCGDDTALLLERVQPAGKNEMAAEEAARGRRLSAGECLQGPDRVDGSEGPC